MNAIKFTPEMVRAIMAGRKCQTRRLEQKGGAGDKLYIDEPWAYHGSEWQADNPFWRTYSVQYLMDGARRKIRLPIATEIAAIKQDIEYPPGFDDLDPNEKERVKDDLLEAWWRRMHKQVDAPLPPQFARVVLKITNVWKDLLWNISHADVVAEGFEYHADFIRYWDLIYGEQMGFRFVDNPVVWVHEFEIVAMDMKWKEAKNEDTGTA